MPVVAAAIFGLIACNGVYVFMFDQVSSYVYSTIYVLVMLPVMSVGNIFQLIDLYTHNGLALAFLKCRFKESHMTNWHMYRFERGTLGGCVGEHLHVSSLIVSDD